MGEFLKKLPAQVNNLGKGVSRQKEIFFMLKKYYTCFPSFFVLENHTFWPFFTNFLNNCPRMLREVPKDAECYCKQLYTANKCV